MIQVKNGRNLPWFLYQPKKKKSRLLHIHKHHMKQLQKVKKSKSWNETKIISMYHFQNPQHVFKFSLGVGGYKTAILIGHFGLNLAINNNEYLGKLSILINDKIQWT